MTSNRNTARRRLARKPTVCKPPVGPPNPPPPGPPPPPLTGAGDASQLGVDNHITYSGVWSGFPTYCFDRWIAGYPMYGSFIPDDPLYTNGTILKNAVGDELTYPPQHL